MTKTQIKNKERIAIAVTKYANAHNKPITLTEAYTIIEYLHRLETTLSRLAETECCDLRFYDEAKQERTEKRAEKYIAEKIGCKCHTQRDPRGFCIRLYLKDKSTDLFFNTWDGETSGLNW